MNITFMDLYKGALSVWVEDQLTHAVLTHLWKDRQINVLVADGKPGVRHMIESRPKRFRDKVYGVVDRDFETDNRAQWLQTTEDLLRLPAHEFENLLLDFDILSQLSGVESAAQIEARARKFAEELLYWMACKGVLRAMQESLSKGFPGDPPMTLNSLQAAAEHLQKSSYWTGHRAAWDGWNSDQARLTALQSEEQRLRADLQTDAWQRTFSGKELFRRLRGAVPKLDATPQRPPDPSPADRDLNLAKLIARKMRETGRIPSEITELHQTLRRKANLPSL